jgi:hypothetical protein
LIAGAEGTQHVERFAAAADRASIDHILLAEPALLDIDPQALRSVRAHDNPGLAIAAERIEHYHEILKRDPRHYPFGHGPVERLWSRVSTGEITLSVAETLAAEPEVTRALNPLYLRWLAGECVEREARGNWKQALELHSLIRAAARGFQPLACAELWVRADLAEYEIRLASVLLLRRADLALYRSGIDVGTAIILEARAAGDARLEGRLLHWLGSLVSNVYLQFPNDASYHERIEDWRRSLPNTAGTTLGKRIESSWIMPPAEEALEQGVEYLRRAAALRSGVEQGQSLALLAPMLALRDALIRRAAHGDSAATEVRRSDEAVQVAREALARIDGATTCTSACTCSNCSKTKASRSLLAICKVRSTSTPTNGTRAWGCRRSR